MCIQEGAHICVELFDLMESKFRFTFQFFVILNEYVIYLYLLVLCLFILGLL